MKPNCWMCLKYAMTLKKTKSFSFCFTTALTLHLTFFVLLILETAATSDCHYCSPLWRPQWRTATVLGLRAFFFFFDSFCSFVIIGDCRSGQKTAHFNQALVQKAFIWYWMFLKNVFKCGRLFWLLVFPPQNPQWTKGIGYKTCHNPLK